MNRNARLKKRAERLKEKIGLEREKTTARRGRPPKDPIKLHVKDLAQAHVEQAIEQLVKIMNRSKSEVSRMAAIELLLAYGWGKPKQAVIGGDKDDPPQRHVHEIRRTIVRPE